MVIKEKEQKILPHRSKYQTWWLALNDRIGFGLDETDLSQLKEGFDIATYFEKIIFISAFDSAYGSELIVNQNEK